jgi:hypothetical protein
MHRVCTHGPEDHKMFRLVIVVADFADAAGANAAVGERLLAERVKVSRGRIHSLILQAVDEGWLAVQQPGGPRRRAVYNLGQNLVRKTNTLTVVSAALTAEHSKKPYLARFDAQKKPRTVNGVGRSSSRRPPSRDGRATAVDKGPHPDVPADPSPNRYRGFRDWTAERLNGDQT